MAKHIQLVVADEVGPGGGWLCGILDTARHLPLTFVQMSANSHVCHPPCICLISSSNVLSCPWGFTFSYTLRNTPFGSITKLVLSQYFVPCHSASATPAACRSSALVSARRSIVKPNLLQKLLCEATSSWLTPTTLMPASSKSDFVAVNDLPWIVQP